MIAELELN